MSMFKFLAKLEKVKIFFTNEVPEALDWTSKVLVEVAEGFKEASEYLKELGKSSQITKEQAIQLEHDNEVLNEYLLYFSGKFSAAKNTNPLEVSEVGNATFAVSLIVLDLIKSVKAKTDLSV